jgi:hypothetical protein
MPDEAPVTTALPLRADPLEEVVMGVSILCPTGGRDWKCNAAQAFDFVSFHPRYSVVGRFSGYAGLEFTGICHYLDGVAAGSRGADKKSLEDRPNADWS